MTRMTMDDVQDAARATIRQNGAPGPLAGPIQEAKREPKPALSPEAREKANAQLDGYAYNVGEDGYFHHADGKRTMIELRFKKGRFEAWGAGSKQWSGPDVGWFVERFWYAKKAG